ncbi:hypothetical protein KDAU_59790 [Dictyobacter aurantiacus]|uniref:Uncharacterized protein n=1 Tax=Dictyobacter aurantiacus TaxID=1936993 RepID=A0A401ZPB0_9CHLR|nr:hypothetical protein KDAU_59790 [Dictyobacter aurantiacus]
MRGIAEDKNYMNDTRCFRKVSEMTTHQVSSFYTRVKWFKVGPTINGNKKTQVCLPVFLRKLIVGIVREEEVKTLPLG